MRPGLRAVGPVLLIVLSSAPAGALQPEARKVADLEFPAGIAVHPDGRIFVTERAGRIRVVRDGRLSPTPLAEIATTTQGETGLLGIAVSPDGRDLYAFATAPDGGSNVVWRVPVEGGEPRPVVEGLPAATYHNGGGVAFDRGGMLLVSNGEQHDTARAQDPAALGGKVYRFTPEGGIPADNPFGDSPAFAIGLRNPFGLAVDPGSGRIYVTDNGPAEFDEVNVVEPGSNLGWPDVVGPAEGAEPSGPGRYRDPIAAYREIIVPTGITVAPPAAPAAARGDVFFGTYGDGLIRRLEIGRSGDVRSDEVFLRAPDPIVALAWGPDGLLYSTTEALYVVRVGGRPSPRPSPTETGNEPTAGPMPGDGERWLPWPVVAGVVAAVVVAAAAAVRAGRRRASH